MTTTSLAASNGHKPDVRAAEDAVRTLMAYCGHLTHPGTEETPRRVVAALAEMTGGQDLDPGTFLGRQFDPLHGGDHDELIAMTGIDFTALCEHHLMPFTGTATVAYLPKPDAPVVGISKLARLVDVYARRLTMQERLTRQITTALDTHLQTLGSACIIRGVHACMGLRGVRKTQAVTVTSSLTGILRDDVRAREELMAITSGGHS